MSGWWLVASVRVSAHLPRVLTVRRAEDARQSEVRQLDDDPAIIKLCGENVLGLYISMQYPPGVQMPESFQHLPRNQSD